MTVFLRIQGMPDLAEGLKSACGAVRLGREDPKIFNVNNSIFRQIPGSPFAYWSSEGLRANFSKNPAFENGDRFARVGLQTSDDFRFVRSWWEPDHEKLNCDWLTFVRGGKASRFFGDLGLVVNWRDEGLQLKAWASKVNQGQHWSRNIRSAEHYKKPGITWPLRSSQLSPYPMPSGSIFSTRGTVAFDRTENLENLLGIMGSSAFDYIFKLLLGRFGHPEFSIGSLQKVPVPEIFSSKLGSLARRSWSLKRTLGIVDETSRAFHLPVALRVRLAAEQAADLEAELADLQTKIDDIAFDLYNFSDADRVAALGRSGSPDENPYDQMVAADDGEDEDNSFIVESMDGLLSWAVGVAFGRFDWRLATSEREAPPEPDPFDPLPAKSPGMLPDGATPFHAHDSILVDDQGQPHDLPRLIEEVLARVQADVPGEVRHWLRRDFFPLHLKQYSKSRRKAPIYWPLSTTSGSYTLWLYYPDLTSQTLYSAVNDFVEPKLAQISREADALRAKGAARSRDDEKTFEALQALELELIELRDNLLQIAPTIARTTMMACRSPQPLFGSSSAISLGRRY